MDLHFLFSPREQLVAFHILKHLPAMRDVASLALVTRHFYFMLSPYLPGAKESSRRALFIDPSRDTTILLQDLGRLARLNCHTSTRNLTLERHIFATLLARNLYIPHPSSQFSQLLSLNGAALNRETEEQCLMRNYLASVPPSIGLDMYGLSTRFNQEYGAAFEIFMSYTREQLAALQIVERDLSLLQLRCEFCKHPGLLRLIQHYKNSPFELVLNFRQFRLGQADERKQCRDKLASLSSSLQRLSFHSPDLAVTSVSPLNKDTLLARVTEKTTIDRPFLVPLTYDTHKKCVSAMSVVRNGLKLFESPINVL